jgi:hypothetical protein
MNEITVKLPKGIILILKSKPIEKKPIKLKGVLKGVKFKEEEIEKVKKSLFKHAYGE